MAIQTTIGTTQFRLGPGAGVLVAIVLGAALAASLGLSAAWVVVALGSAVLLLAPWMARAQVHSIRSVELPRACTVHAGKTVPIRAQLGLRRRARMVLVALVRPGDETALKDRAPRLLLASISAPFKQVTPEAKKHANVMVSLPLRVTTRGRSSSLCLVLRSSYPFGLISASRSLPVRLELTALPRLLRERDAGLTQAMARLAGASERNDARSAQRGEGPPSGLRDARLGDSQRHLHMRASLRRGRWIAVERPELGSGLAEVTLHLPPLQGSPSRRALAAFEAATSMAASIVQGLHRLGFDVDLGISAQHRGRGGQIRSERKSLVRSKRTLTHLLGLVDVALTPTRVEESPSEASLDKTAALSRGAHRAEAPEALMSVELIPIASPFGPIEQRPPARPRTRSARGASSQLMLFIDASGRVSQPEASR